MEEELINFETAKLTKEKGFDELCRWHYTQNSPKREPQLFSSEFEPESLNTWNGRYSAPTQSLLQKWFREIHFIDIIISSNLLGYGYIIYQRYPSKNYTNTNVYQYYEEALEAVLVEALKLLP